MFEFGSARFRVCGSAISCLILTVSAGCGTNTDSATAANAPVLRLATTTSTRDSGLLEELLPRFETAHRCRVDVVAVGTGAALKLGEAGDADVVLVHARQAEEQFLAAGHGVCHEEFMYNHFVLLGPVSDPARVRGLDPVEAFMLIGGRGCGFVSRGDDSGTHKREQSLWKAAGGRPTWENYLESGQGMGTTLVMADEKQAYVLSDFGTFLRFETKIELEPLATTGDSLRNPYAAIAVNPAKHARINGALGVALVEFLLSREAQRLIANYRVRDHQLFYPTRLNLSESGG